MKMSVTAHLEDMRWRIIRCLIYIFVSSAIGLLFADKILYILKLPSNGLIESFLILKPTEAITIYIKTAIFSGFVLASPFIFREIFAFIKPAADEKIFSAILWVMIAFALFVIGGTFVYFIIFPKAIAFLMSLSQGLTGSKVQITLTSYVSFTIALLFCGGMIFQIPLISFILTKLGLITPRFLSSKRKEAYFALCVIAAIITPTTDVFSLGLFVAPMIVLYEIGIIFSKTVYKSKIIESEKIYEEQN